MRVRELTRVVAVFTLRQGSARCRISGNRRFSCLIGNFHAFLFHRQVRPGHARAFAAQRDFLRRRVNRHGLLGSIDRVFTCQCDLRRCAQAVLVVIVIPRLRHGHARR